MEILISVMIITVVAFSLLKIFSQNRAFAIYIDKRPLISFSSTLYSFIDLSKYNKSEKNVYDLIYQDFDIKNDEVRKYLKDSKRVIEVDEEQLIFEDEEMGMGIFSTRYGLKGSVTSFFFRLKLDKSEVK